MNITSYLKEKSELINKHLDKLIPEEKVSHNQLFQAARYSLLGSGKRIRPILTLATLEAFGIDDKIGLTPACAIEMIHTYSLIHDDLPCMDDDDFRRGKPTLHKSFPEAHAVLAGDYLLTRSFEVIANDTYLSADQKVKLISLLSNKAGGGGMIAGQIMDIEAEGKRVNLDCLQNIHLNKTGALIAASIIFGGIIGNSPNEHLTILEEFGEKVGLAFQVIDDVLDVTSSQKKLGKTIGSDLNNDKSTYVTLMGVDQAKVVAHSLLNAAIKKLATIPHDTSKLQKLATTLVVRES